MSGERVLVTGGAGFLGSHLCEALVGDGHEVVCLDNFGSGRPDNVAHLEGDEQFELLDADVREPPSIDGLDAVYHLASRASPADFERHPVDIALTNAEGTREVLELARENDARALLASTSEVYGDPEVHPQHEGYNGNVDPRGPRAPYDEGKRFAEALATAYGREHGLDVRTVRIFNTYGPRMRPDDGRVIPNFLTQALSGRDLTVYGDGSQTRSFCYVTDLVAGLRAVMDAGGLGGEVFNLGNPDERTIIELAEVVVDVVDTDSGITHEPLPEDDPSRRRPDVSKVRSRLGWEPTVGLRDGVKRTVGYFTRKARTSDDA